LNQPAISVSSTPSRVAPVITKQTSSLGWARTPRDMPSSELYAQSGGASSKVSHSSDKAKVKAYADDQSHSTPSATSPKPPSLPEHAITKAGPPSLSQSESGPYPLSRSKSRIQARGGVERDALRVAEPSTSEKERKRITATEGHEARREDSMTDSYGTLRRKADPTGSSSHTPNVKHHLRTPRPADGSDQRTFSSDISYQSNSSLAHLPGTNESRGKAGRPLDSAVWSDRTEASITGTPPVSLSARNQSNHDIRAPSINDSTISNGDHRPRPPNDVGGLHLQTTYSMLPHMISPVSAPITSHKTEKEQETPSGPILPSNSMRSVRPSHAVAVRLASQDGQPSVQVSREHIGDSSSRPPGDHGETHPSIRVPMESTRETMEHRPHANINDQSHLDQLSGTSSIVSDHLLTDCGRHIFTIAQVALALSIKTEDCPPKGNIAQTQK
jgi:hypothetical protein